MRLRHAWVLSCAPRCVPRLAERKELNAPLAAAFAFFGLLGSGLGYLITGPLVDAFGISVLSFVLAIVALFFIAILIYATWEFIGLTKLEDDDNK